MGPIGWAKTANPSTATRHNGARTISQLRRTTMAVAPIRLGRDQPKRHSITGSGYIAALANEQGFAYPTGRLPLVADVTLCADGACEGGTGHRRGGWRAWPQRRGVDLSSARGGR